MLTNGKAETHAQVTGHMSAVRNTHIPEGQDRGDGDMKGTVEEVMLERGGWTRGTVKKLSRVGRQGWAGRGQDLEKVSQRKGPHVGHWGKEDTACWDVRLSRGHGESVCVFSLACQCDPRSPRGPVARRYIWSYA